MDALEARNYRNLIKTPTGTARTTTAWNTMEGGPDSTRTMRWSGSWRPRGRASKVGSNHPSCRLTRPHSPCNTRRRLCLRDALPKLVDLAITFDATTVPTIGINGTRRRVAQERLASLHVAHSSICKPRTVAKFLHAVSPELHTIRTTRSGERAGRTLGGGTNHCKGFRVGPFWAVFSLVLQRLDFALQLPVLAFSLLHLARFLSQLHVLP
ncbi:hypothetical protein C8R46DRAFT_295437 [Mycena filopes]|nr:hypothetical protein C8R46DRAFT_295437 [Mycena filopes]